MNRIWIYILCMAAVTFLIRVLPLTFIRKPIKNKILRSFLYYVPYVTLSVMTFPAIMEATRSPLAGAIAFAVAIAAAYFGKSLSFVALSACLTVLVSEAVIFFVL